jgi:ubiquinone/menaquinone biosynthesis C-methylase UbiE
MPADLKAIYERMHSSDAAAWRPRVLRPHAWTTHRYDDIARLLADEPRRDALLEIGSGQGQMLAALAERYARLAGIDLSDNAVAIARAVFAERYPQLAGKIEVVAGSADERLPWTDDSFDAVIACAVLEHTVDLFAALDEIARVVRPGGVVVLTVPNLAYIKHTVGLLFGYLPRTGTPTRDMAYWRQHGWDGGHLHYFTRASLAALLRETGFEPEAWTGDGYLARARRWGTNLVGNLTVRARRRSDR